MPVVREKWELNNDDVELVDKIGRGNFGDVYRYYLHLEVQIYICAVRCRNALPRYVSGD